MPCKEPPVNDEVDIVDNTLFNVSFTSSFDDIYLDTTSKTEFKQIGKLERESHSLVPDIHISRKLVNLLNHVFTLVFTH